MNEIYINTPNLKSFLSDFKQTREERTIKITTHASLMGGSYLIPPERYDELFQLLSLSYATNKKYFLSEVINTTPGATASTVVYDFSTGTNWYHSSANTNYTANFINVPTTNNRAITTSIVINQGSTAYIPTSVRINSVSQTIKWAGGTASGTPNQVDIVGFTFIRDGVGNWTQVLGQINTFD